MCRVLDVSRSGYYAWRKRGMSARGKADEALGEMIKAEYGKHHGRYGSPRIRAVLARRGHKHGRKRIARIMAEMGLYSRKKRKKSVTTHADASHRHAPNVLNREFTATNPNQKWVSDIKEIKTDEGSLYLAVTADLFSRMVVGWAMSESMEATLTRQAFDMAVKRRQPDAGLLHHSDRGSQYSDAGFRGDLLNHKVEQSMSRKGNVWDNAAMESIFATLEKESLQARSFATRNQAKTEVFEYLEAYYNRVRLHSTLGYLSPSEFEAQFQHQLL